MRLPRSGLAALACLGLTVAAEIASLVLSWGFADPLDTSLFALYNITLTAVGLSSSSSCRATLSGGSCASLGCRVR